MANGDGGSDKEGNDFDKKEEQETNEFLDRRPSPTERDKTTYPDLTA